MGRMIDRTHRELTDENIQRIADTYHAWRPSACGDAQAGGKPTCLLELTCLPTRLRGHKVMLDADLATLYGVETGALTRVVRRNIDRFPQNFMFQHTEQQVNDLRCQFGTSINWGGRRYPPYAFTEQGVAMLSRVLRSTRAVQVNIEIMRPNQGRHAGLPLRNGPNTSSTSSPIGSSSPNRWDSGGMGYSPHRRGHSGLGRRHSEHEAASVLEGRRTFVLHAQRHVGPQ
jgi:hypothetical protein